MTVGEVIGRLKNYPLDLPVVTMSDCWEYSDYSTVSFIAGEKNGLQYMSDGHRTNSKEEPCVIIVAAM